MAKFLHEIDTGDVPVEDFIKAATDRGIFVYDLETEGLNFQEDKIEGIALYVPASNTVDELSVHPDLERDSVRHGKALSAWYPFIEETVLLYVQPDETPEETLARLNYEASGSKEDLEAYEEVKQEPELRDLREPMDQAETMEALRPLFEDYPDLIGVAFHEKFDAQFVEKASGLDREIKINFRRADAMLLDFLGDENDHAYGLKHRVLKLLGHEMVTYEAAAKLKRQQTLSFMADKIQPLGIYAMEDCYWEWEIFDLAYRRIMEEDPDGSVEGVFWGIDMPVSEILQEMEGRGVKIDWRWLRKVAEDLQQEKDKILDRMTATLGWVPNPNSSKQMATLLFGPKEQGNLGLPDRYVAKGDGGIHKTGSKEIGHLKRVDPIVEDILKWRSLDTVQSSFAVKISELTKGGARLHSHFNQHGTKIFRLSCVAKGTPVRVMGGEVPIESVQVGESVYTYDDQLAPTFRQVIKVQQTGTKPVVRLHWRGSGGLVGHLDLTSDHPVRKVNGDYARVWQLKRGNRVLAIDEDGRKIRVFVVNIEALEGVVDVYDLEISGTKNFIAGGICVHNSSNPVNLQNQPRDPELIRKAFCAHTPEEAAFIEAIDDPEERARRGALTLVLLGADYSQIELRVAAHLTGDKGMLEVYRMLGGCHALDGEPCGRYRMWVCKPCEKKLTKERKSVDAALFFPKTGLPDEAQRCPTCNSEKVEHQVRCRHVDLHQRTAEDVGVPRNPLAKCLDGSTLVLGAIGDAWVRPRSIEDLIGNIEPGEHQEIPETTLSVAGRYGRAKATTALKRHDRPTKIVVTKRAVVVATEDHRFQVLDPNGYYHADHGPKGPNYGAELSFLGYVHEDGKALVEARNLEKGMKVPFAAMASHRADDPAFHELSYHGELRINPFTKEVDPDGPARIELDEEWAYFAGMFAGDGCASGNACVITHGHTDAYAEWRQVVRETCDAIGLPNRVSKNKKHTVMGSRVVRRYFAGLRLAKEAGKTGAKIMRVPPWVLAGGPKMIWTYLAGLFDTDGTVGNEKSGTVSVTMKSPEFAGQIAFLLRWLGMPVLVQPGFNKTYERWYYTIHVLAEGFTRFLNYCPMRYREKVEKLKARDAAVKRRIAPDTDEVMLVLDGGERTVYDFQIDTEDHLYLQGGLIGHNNLNFGSLYRIGPYRFCQYADLYDDNGEPRLDYAKEVLEGWYRAYPAIEVFHALTESHLRSHGWVVKTITGRRRRLTKSRYESEHKAVTQGIQYQVSGTAQDILKASMIRIFRKREAIKSKCGPAERKMWDQVRFLIQVHDELILESCYALRHEVADLIKWGMEGAAELKVPLPVDVKIGRTWDDIH